MNVSQATVRKVPKLPAPLKVPPMTKEQMAIKKKEADEERVRKAAEAEEAKRNREEKRAERNKVPY